MRILNRLEAHLISLKKILIFFMKLSVDSVKINRFDRFSEFTHASSSRYFENQSGEIEQYDFAAKENLRNKNFHVNQFMKTVQLENKIPFLLNQVHSDRVFILKDVIQGHEQVAKIKADAIITHLPETPIGIFTADCIPVLICDLRLHVAAAIHAGRKGTCQSIVNKTIMAMTGEYGCRPADLVAGLGPGIGGCCYEIDENCLNSFDKKIPFDPPYVKPRGTGKFLLDLYELNIQQAVDAGVLPENIFRSEECTFCSPMNYFSYRREGQTGRILTFIMLC